jgi:hypothetical protein
MTRWPEADILHSQSISTFIVSLAASLAYCARLAHLVPFLFDRHPQLGRMLAIGSLDDLEKERRRPAVPEK